ncbi:hypothetical protein LPB67_07770 [Undibacterium sp. Jales W-56]|uniref:PilN domain-containing protein n=1 Tax=Undibacterium sp. Jales W-56 TaxID=2897325 RepID=UPI0021D04957|nr:PilN domain-containing protein [Undibacterium sp. Jales W-56]MCU6433675.1 hypothetical protein [Undibacterium sp. Jales W-56]
MRTELSDLLQPRLHYGVRLWGIAILLTFCAGWLAGEAYNTTNRTTTVREKTNSIKLGILKTQPPKLNKQEEEIEKKWTELAIERKFEWDVLFQSIEHASNPDIELLEFQPDKTSRTVSFMGEAKNHKALIQFIQALSKQIMFRQVYLVHQQTLLRDRLQTISFEIKCAIVEQQK